MTSLNFQNKNLLHGTNNDGDSGIQTLSDDRPVSGEI